MSELKIFITMLFVMGAIFILMSLVIFKYMKPENTSKIEKLPRNIILGIFFGIIDIVWCAPQAVEIFSQSSAMLVWSIAVAALIIGCIFLDYLFARALAGFLILLAHYFLRASFAIDIPLLWFFSLMCVLLGTVGVFFGGAPHLFRDLLRKLCNSRKWNYPSLIIFLLYAVVMIAPGIILVIK